MKNKTYKHRLHDALELVNKQANDESLWFVAETITEAHLQKALRELHKAVEGQSSEYVRRKAIERVLGVEIVEVK